MKIATVVFAVLFGAVNAVPVPEISWGKLIDLTHPFDETTLGFSGMQLFDLTITHHEYTPADNWLQMEDFSVATHVGTHFDAPCHIVRGQWTMEDIPLDRLMAPAAVVDISQRASVDRDTNLEIQDLVEWEEKTNQSLNGTIVLVNTGWWQKWRSKKEFLGTDTDDLSKIHFPGISPEAAEWLAQSRAIYGIGIDTTSLGNGQAVQRRAHEALFRANIYGMENVDKVQLLPAHGAQLYVFPMRINAACGAPTRILARLP